MMHQWIHGLARRSSIVYSLVPNVTRLEEYLRKFCMLSQADEVVSRRTWLAFVTLELLQCHSLILTHKMTGII
jgi:hypothetical protein